MPFCQHCGQELLPDTKFCPRCGVAVEKADEDSTNKRKQVFEGEIRKCPNCGELLKSFEAVCPACGYELRGVHTAGAVREFAQKLEQIEADRELTEGEEPLDVDGLSKTDKRKINLIRNFVVPNTKEDIFEFLILAGSNMTTMQDTFDAESSRSKLAVGEAWEAKFFQIYSKAKLILGTGKEFEKVQEIYRKIQISTWKKNFSKAVSSYLRFASTSPILAIGLLLLLAGGILYWTSDGAYASVLILSGMVMVIVASVRYGKEQQGNEEYSNNGIGGPETAQWEISMMFGSPKNKWVALALCICLGPFGAHRFYEGNIGMGVLYLFTFGLLGIGWIVDIIKLLGKPNPYYVRRK